MELDWLRCSTEWKTRKLEDMSGKNIDRVFKDAMERLNKKKTPGLNYQIGQDRSKWKILEDDFTLMVKNG